MHNLFSTEVTNEMILDSFDSLYSAIKEGELIKNTKISRETLENGNYKVNLELEFETLFGKTEKRKKFSVSNGDLIKIEPK